MSDVTESAKLEPSSAAFGAAAAVTVVFNTALAWAKDAHHPLQNRMNAIAGHNWTTQGLADVLLFIVLGLLFLKAGWAEKIGANRLISSLVAAVIVAWVGLFAWYALF